MTEKLKNIIQEDMMKLPKEIQEAINSFDWIKVTEEIGKKFRLLEDQISNLQVETWLVLIGLEDVDSYATNVEYEVGTTKDEANKIAGEAYQQIFTPIYKKLTENIKKNLQNKNPNAEQTLNFILSGGDYSAFVTPSPLQGEGQSEVNPAPPSLADIQANVNKPPKKMQDIRSKFTI